MKGSIRILTEASGSLTAAWLLRAIREAGHQPVGSDILEVTPALCLADDFIRLPSADDPRLWEQTATLLRAHRIDLVIPSLDETLAGWAERREAFAAAGTQILISPSETLAVCQDKWRTYQFFREQGIPTVATSREQRHPLVKPRFGRGGSGVRITKEPVDMTGMLSQEVAAGFEVTVDALFNHRGEAVYVVPRRRIGVRDGKSTGGETFAHAGIERLVRRIGEALPFHGPINFQCFLDGNTIRFIEINPRIAGGMALGLAATENWIRVIVEHLLPGKAVTPVPVRYGLRMVRYYAECFIEGASQ